MEEFKKLTDEELAQVTGGTNWAGFGACLLSHGAGAIPALSELVRAVRAKDYPKVARLVNQAAIQKLPLVAECLASC